MIIGSTGYFGVHFNDAETLEHKYTYKSDDQYYQQLFIKSLNMLIIGSQSGQMIAIDLSNINNVDKNDESIAHKFYTVDAGTRAFDVSPYPEEKYVAVGTEKGTIHVFESRHVKERKPYKYAMIHPHGTWVRGIQFIPSGDDYLLGSFSEGGEIHVYCLKERSNLYKYSNIPNGVLNMVFCNSINSLLIISKQHEFFEISFNFNDSFCEEYTQQINTDLVKNIKQRFLRESD